MKAYNNVFKNADTIWNIVFIILYDLGIFIASMPVGIPGFFEGWQRDIANMPIASPGAVFHAVYAYQTMLLTALLMIFVSRKSVGVKLIGSVCVILPLQRLIDSGIPNRRLERTLLSPLKEQCYLLLQHIPLISIIYSFFIWALLVIFRRDLNFEPDDTATNRIILLSIWGLNFFVLPYILRPLITMWL